MAEMPRHGGADTANDAFKEGYADWVLGGVIAAVALHFGLFVLVRPFQAADLGAADPTAVLELPPEVQIPPPPERIARPATPRMAEVELPDDPTVPRSTWDANPPERLPPPPRAGARADRPPFIPYDTPPRLRNEREVGRLLERFYPRSLKSAGIGGAVVLWIYVSEEGRVEESVVKESSGHGALDAAARRVASRMVFEPAMSRDRRTGVWVSQNITFEVR